MNKRNKVYISTILVTLALLGIFIAARANSKNRDLDSELAELRIDSISTAAIQNMISPGYLDNVFDQNQETRLVSALNRAVILPEPKPDQIVSLEILISLTNGKQITIADSGDAEFLVITTANSKPESFMMASTDLKDLLLPYQDLFKREISLKKNISLYGTDRITGIVLEDTPIQEDTSVFSEEVFTLHKGNLIRTLAKKTSHGVEWTFVDTVVFDVPNPVGWIESSKFTTEPTTLLPNEGFLNQEVDICTEPSTKSSVLEKRSGQLYVNKRINGWAECGFPGGAEGGWVRESDITYIFPADYNMGY
jgi:hypothetical protein